MANVYKITIANQSGKQQRYALFAEKPAVTGTPQEGLQHVFATAHTASDQIAFIEIHRQYYAMCGLFESCPGRGVNVSVVERREVTLGIVHMDGTQSPGTTLSMTVIDGVPQFRQEMTLKSAANAFEIDTDDSFTYEEAVKYNYAIGVGGPARGGDTGAIFTFTPHPNTVYQLSPTNTFLVTATELEIGQLVDPSTLGKTVEVDFTKEVSGLAVIVHGVDDNLVIQH
ncbi:uncharacterized protein Z520_10077 [Fonsecaea multimorphosa CBS 102226]|uniref:Uncharacterized protein n=1 Tax=Fonsecaea multimorphosa CBS 102226 TaxID=1442371 RepID=A0A0D2IA73_9EURO|nr:uncharacterized protein Z520_10077 [Fonsecaea multimorphosa CBS 102226]KIX94051.1 hypothetical protein Z520_10077 [Fonsecaea multimorphosa CBS 102226]OAL19405.1 hypothetical protein AYO22_09567 [Fonsecaea multimorphosa]